MSVYIDTMLTSISYTPLKLTIFRVGDHLRSINPEAYDPQIIAIGPFHRGKPHLQNMEQHKLSYLRMLLQERGELSAKRYVTEIRRLEDRARKCYAEDIHLDEDEFVAMLILDGFFIIKFLLKFLFREYVDPDDPIFQHEHIQNQLLHDLMLFENQIPFFIIDCLFNMIDDGDINDITWPLLRNSIFPLRKEDFPEDPINGHHLLGIVHDIQCSSFAKILSHLHYGNTDNVANSAEKLKKAGSSSKKSEGDSFFREELKEAGSSSKKSEGVILSKMNSGNPGNPNNMVNINSGEELKEAGSSSRKSKGEELKEAGISSKKSEGEEIEEAESSSKKSEGEKHKKARSSSKKSKKSEGNPNNMVNINSAEELTEAGISFKKLHANSLFEIKFENKVLKIPKWKISDSTESLFRNLIAYEYYLTDSPRKFVTDYVYFMHCLIRSPEDAKLLRLSGIISNFLGGDEMVYRVINQLEKNITISREFSYSKTFCEVKSHCKRPWNIWMAILRRDYFSSPWALISVLAAIILLVLAIIQTTFAILSFRNDLMGN